MLSRFKILICLLAALATSNVAATEINLSFAYFMGPKHHFNDSVFKPFARHIEELSNGTITVTQFPGGALNSSPPKQYSIMLSGVADIVYALPGYTSDLFPKTNLLGLPDVCDNAVECTHALINARQELEPEYDAKVLALIGSGPQILITRDKAVRTLEDLQGMKIRVASKLAARFVEAVGASAVSQPITVVHQNLANGVIDGVLTTPAAIRLFKLYEPAKYVTTYFPGSGLSFAILMNKQVYQNLSEQQRAWIDAASTEELAIAGAHSYHQADLAGIQDARDAGVEVIDIPESEKERFRTEVMDTLDDLMNMTVGDMKASEIVSMMKSGLD
ncbi:MAG: TRAP transporter substrate-binding protein [Acidiferrobacterales bacterium]|nr:TRAP transporter substrate-binding protein [Acidiferrobacterales bacterium]